MAVSFKNWPNDEHTPEAVQGVPYLDVSGEDEPTDFLFTLDGKHGLIARSNLHTLKGTKKVGKSAAGLALIVAALKGEFIGIKANHEKTAVLWIDTEQDKNTLRQKARAVLSMAGLETAPEWLKIVTLRGYGSPADALAASLQAIAENKADFVFLDGVVDLCESFNDEEKSRAALHQLEAAAEQYGAAILGLIHTNKYNDEARGHLGTIIEQKSGEVYIVTKDGNAAKVVQDCSRFSAPIPPFSFTFADKFKITPPEEGNTDLERFAALDRAFAPLFTDSDKMTNTELVAAYGDYHQKSKRTAQEAIKAATFAHVLDRIVEGRRVYYSRPFQHINPDEDEI